MHKAIKFIQVGGMRKAQVEFDHCLGAEYCFLSESFIVSNVTNILLSFGRLLKTGWNFCSVEPQDQKTVDQFGQGPCAGVLVSPDLMCRIPVFYKKNSLSVFAHARRVKDEREEECAVVRTVYVRMQVNVEALKSGWQFLENGNPVHKQHGKQFVDPGTALSRRTWRFRTTIVLVGRIWEVVEHSKEISTLSDLEADIPGLVLDTTVLTFPQRHIEPLSSCMCKQILDAQLPEVMDELEGTPEQGPDIFSKEAGVPAELQDAPMLQKGGQAGGHEEQPESVWVNGKELTRQSKVKDLQNGCNFLGVNASVSKAKLYDPLCSYLFKQHQKDVDRSKTSLQKQMMGPQPRVQDKAEERPTDVHELERHFATHLPFASWCDICVKTKSREDRTVQNTDAEVEQPADPHIQMDWMYLGRSCPALVIIDAATRYGAILPTRTKGAWRAAAEFCVKFSLELNYLDNVVFVMDSEPATLGLLDMIIMIRQEMGYKSTKKVGRPYHKGRTARVERYIQTVRRQAAALVAGVEDGVKEKLDELHCLRAWALTHSVFLLNRFHEHAAIKSTAYEMVHGRKYNGRSVPFGEFVFGLRQPVQKKSSSIWLGGVWVGKDSADMNVIVTPGGQFHTRSIRRGSSPWRPDVVQALTMSPWSKHKPSGPVGLLEAPLATIEERQEGPDPREPFRLGTGGIDEEAEEVAVV